MMQSNRNRYPPLADYGYIADCHSSALVSRGEARLIDRFPMREGGKQAPHQQILRTGWWSVWPVRGVSMRRTGS